MGRPGEGYDWPASNHGIDVDHKGNIWIGGNGRGQSRAAAALPHDESAMGRGQVHDSMVLKFSQSGQFLMQIGKPFTGTGSNDPGNFKLPAKTLVDPQTNELYVADGYGNRRVIVLDATAANTSATGERTATSPTTRSSGRTIRAIRRRSSSVRRCMP